MNMIPSWVANYVGIPFSDRGSTRAGCNCAGLMYMIFREQKGIVLPSEDILPADNKMLADSRIEYYAKSAESPWKQVDKSQLQAFDAVLLGGTQLHVGLMVNATHILHVWKSTHAVIMPIKHMRIARRILGFYRHEALS